MKNDTLIDRKHFKPKPTMNSVLAKYAKLLLHYCLELKAGEKLFVQTTMLATPLAKELYQEALRIGALIEFDFSFAEKGKMYFENATDELITTEPIFYKQAMETFDAFLAIRAPYNLREDQSIDSAKRKKRSLALKGIQQTYFERTADRSLKRSLCQYPTQASAQEAGMSLSEYEQFVFQACRLFDEDPQASWLEVRSEQQKYVDYLNRSKTIRYKSDRTDITFSVDGRTWINSDGQANMPSGEVFSGPVEDSVQGVVHFDYPAVYLGKEAQGITLWVENGEVVKWEAEKGQDLLDQIFDIPGARFFGEVAIGTNYRIQRATKNILFDEKIGGSIHMAIGQSYKQTGGKNESAIHWDMISDMRKGGEIWADGELIYKDGKFVI